MSPKKERKLPLLNIGWIDGGKISFTVSLLGTSGSPETASRETTGTATAGWRFNADGTTNRRQGTWGGNYDDWALPNSPEPGSTFEIRATRQSGTETSLDVGNLLTWESLSTTITYELSNGKEDNSTEDIVLKIEVRDAATQTIQDTGYYKISVKSNSSGTTTTTTTTGPPPTTLPPTSGP
jgi:hypothetical protein